MNNLPQSIETHDQERRSIIRFNQIVPLELFLVRSEDGGDYGVDKILELRINGQLVTNYRIYVQMKSILGAKRHQDKTFSFPVPISTLNYLMNQPNSIFVLYLENEDIFLWDWTTEISLFAQNKNIEFDKSKQKTISYRFYKNLNDEAFSEIHSRVLTNGSIIRTVSEFISSASKSEERNAALILRNGKLINTEEVVKQLKLGGIALVNNGYVGLVGEILNALPPDYKSDPDVALIYAYTKFQSGYLFDALNWLPKGSAKEKLSHDNKILTEFIEIAIKYSLGLMTQEQYVSELYKIEQKAEKTILGVQIKIERARKSVALGISDNLYAEVDTIRTYAVELQNMVQQDNALKLHADCLLWELDGWLFYCEYSKEVAFQQMRNKMGRPDSFEDRLKKAKFLVKRHTEWFDTYKILRARTQDNPVMFGNIVSTASKLILHFIAHSQYFTGVNLIDNKPTIQEVIQELMLAKGVLISNKISHLDLECSLAIAEALEGMGEKDKTVQILNEVYDKAIQLGLTDIQKSAEAQLSGRTLFSVAQKVKSEISVTPNENIRNTSKQERLQMARYFLEAYGLDEKRLPNIIKEMEWLKSDAEDSYFFCRYLTCLQNLNHTLSTETIYSIDPRRLMTCALYGYRSDYESTDRNQLLLYFKEKYCNKCNSRLPECSDNNG